MFMLINFTYYQIRVYRELADVPAATDQSLITCSFALCACTRSVVVVFVTKMTVRSLLSLFLLSLVEVHCQTFPYISFMGQTLVNHSYVDLSLVGYSSDGSNSVQCHTDLSTCCSGSQGFHRGDWYFPSGDRLPLSGNVYEARGAQRVELRCTTATGPTCIYRCDIATMMMLTSQ